jgi:hypothetical protein
MHAMTPEIPMIPAALGALLRVGALIAATSQSSAARGAAGGSGLMARPLQMIIGTGWMQKIT